MSDMLTGSPYTAHSSLPDIDDGGRSDFVPTRGDFLNVLHSWASSKARRKGLHAEALLLRMAELAAWYPDHFSPPDSKAIYLVAKCHAGSTREFFFWVRPSSDPGKGLQSIPRLFPTSRGYVR